MALLRPDAALEDDLVDSIPPDRGDDGFRRAAIVMQRIGRFGRWINPVECVDSGRGGNGLAWVTRIRLCQFGVFRDVDGDVLRVAGEQDRPDPGPDEHPRQVR